MTPLTHALLSVLFIWIFPAVGFVGAMWLQRQE